MIRTRNKNNGFHLVEIVALMAIILFVADLFIHSYFREELILGESGLYEALGLDPFWANTIMVIVFVSYVLLRANRQSNKLNKKAKGS